MPFKADRRHQYWTVDVRYIDVHQLGGGNVYCITILDNYSRFIVASATLPHPGSDRPSSSCCSRRSPSTAHPRRSSATAGASSRQAALAIYAALGIQKEQIQRRQPWQSYIETNFNVQRRMADYYFAQATTWEELLRRHAAGSTTSTARSTGPTGSGRMVGAARPRCWAG